MPAGVPLDVLIESVELPDAEGVTPADAGHDEHDAPDGRPVTP